MKLSIIIAVLLTMCHLIFSAHGRGVGKSGCSIPLHASEDRRSNKLILRFMVDLPRLTR
jgi:hypothetical protein